MLAIRICIEKKQYNTHDFPDALIRTNRVAVQRDQVAQYVANLGLFSVVQSRCKVLVQNRVEGASICKVESARISRRTES